MTTNVLILGGTAEANEIVARLSKDSRFSITLSLAGRTISPRLPPVKTRIGGFGGVPGLAEYLRANSITVLIGATHPFAERIGANACVAASMTGVPLLTLARRAWQPVNGDRWTEVADLDAAAAALPQTPARVFLTVGRQSLAAFAARPQHHYLIRVIDPPELPPAITHTEVVIGRGPFAVADEIELLRVHRIDWLVCKNSGGVAAEAKLTAARALKLPVVLVRQPAIARSNALLTVDAVLDNLLALHDTLTKRSV